MALFFPSPETIGTIILIFSIFFPAGTVFNDATSETNEVGGADYYIEVMILADKSMVDYHGKTHIEKYLNTMSQIVRFL